MDNSLGIYVAKHDSIDQYILNNPDYLLNDGNIEDAVINLHNNYVYAQHIRCAAQEVPLTSNDTDLLAGDRLEKSVKMWKQAGQLVGTLNTQVQYDGPPRPQRHISIYSTNDIQFTVKSDSSSLDMEPINKERAYREFHKGAIFLHKGERYEVTEFVEDTSHPHIVVEETDVDYYTQTLSDTTITNLESKQQYDLTPEITLHWGEGSVNLEYYGFKKKNIYNNQPDDSVYSTGLEPLEMNTQLLWLEVDKSYIANLREEYNNDWEQEPGGALLGGIHALEHALISMSPLELRMSKDDLGGLSQLSHPELDGNGAIFIYDTVEGGIGFTKGIYDNFSAVCSKAQNLITNCGCGEIEGCPACVMEDNCGSHNEPLNTNIARQVTDHISIYN